MTNLAEWLQRRMAAGEVVIMDGGAGTEIFRRGVPLSATTWSGSANLTHPEVIRQIHGDYIRAGADV